MLASKLPVSRPTATRKRHERQYIQYIPSISTCIVHYLKVISQYRQLLPLLHKHFPLLVKCSLVLQPLSVSLYRTNLLTVIIWHWVRHTRRRRINAILLDPSIKLLFFLNRKSALFIQFIFMTYSSNIRLMLAVEQIEDSCSNRRSHEPPDCSETSRHESQGNERVKGYLSNQGFYILHCKHLYSTNGCCQSRSDRRAQLEISSSFAQLEIAVPVKLFAANRRG